jgi:hypothetical protein
MKGNGTVNIYTVSTNLNIRQQDLQNALKQEIPLEFGTWIKDLEKLCQLSGYPVLGSKSEPIFFKTRNKGV